MSIAAERWTGRIEQELGCAVRANNGAARVAHLELAILHLEAERRADMRVSAREMLTSALSTRLAEHCETSARLP